MPGRYVGGVCGKRWAHFWGVIAPWLVGFVFTQGPIFADLLNWTALLFSGAVNFILPFVLYIIAFRQREKVETAGPSTAGKLHRLLNYLEDIPKKIAETLLEELPAEENVFPAFLRPHHFKVVGALLLMITILILVQIGLDFYYLVALHQNLIS